MRVVGDWLSFTAYITTDGEETLTEMSNPVEDEIQQFYQKDFEAGERVVKTSTRIRLSTIKYFWAFAVDGYTKILTEEYSFVVKGNVEDVEKVLISD
jgi:hypothetical protein